MGGLIMSETKIQESCKETLEELKAIIENAPEGATHYSEDGYWLIKSDGTCYCHFFNWCEESVHGDNIRSLSDIKRIIELMELVGDIAALGFLEVGHDSGKSHRDVCKKFKGLFQHDHE